MGGIEEEFNIYRVMVPFGGDRLDATSDGESPVLVCRFRKDWVARKAATRTSPEHPGTAVVWDDRIFEVVESSTRADGTTRYRLAPWPENHVMRTTSPYDRESELARSREREREARVERQARLAALMAPLTGLLPARVQEELERSLGVSAARMTIISAFPLFLAGAAATVFLLVSMFGGVVGIGEGWLLAGLYFLIESSVRLSRSFGAGEPCGSVVGLVAWAVWKRLPYTSDHQVSFMRKTER